jgi:hypothetical protein
MFVTLVAGAVALGAQDQPPAGQQPPAQPPAGQQQDPLKFNSEAAVIIWQVKPEGAADFESAWSEIKTKLAASEKPDVKEQAASLTMFKAVVPPQAGQPVVYVFEISPASKTLSYNPAAILYAEGFMERAQADALFKKIGDNYVNISALPLQKIGGGMGMGMGMQ